MREDNKYHKSKSRQSSYPKKRRRKRDAERERQTRGSHFSESRPRQVRYVTSRERGRTRANPRQNVHKDVRKRDAEYLKKIDEKPSRSVGKKLMSLCMSLLFYILTFGIIITSILFAFSDSEDKNLFGFRVLGVLTDSMSPQEGSPAGGFYAGDVIIVKDIPGESAQVGDILTYHPNIKSKTFLTHRVVEKLDELDGTPGPYYITKGDANNTEDVPVHAKQVVGKTVFVIPKVGTILSFIRDNFIISMIFIISIFGFIVVMRMYFFN